jgi:hypothetical protein
MDAKSEELLKDRSDAIFFELNSKKKLVRHAEPFSLKEGKMYKVGQDKRLCRCLTIS